MDVPFSFNRSVGIRSRRDRITGDSVALTERELLRRCGTIRRCGSPRATGRSRGPAPAGVVQVVVDRPRELIPRCFLLPTSMPPGEISG